MTINKILTDLTTLGAQGDDGHIGRLKRPPGNYSCSFNLFELIVCRIVELCILNNFFFLFFDFNVAGK